MRNGVNYSPIKPPLLGVDSKKTFICLEPEYSYLYISKKSNHFR